MAEDIEVESKTAPVQTLPGVRSVSPVDIHHGGTEKKRNSSVVAAQKILEHSKDADEAMKAFASGEVVELDEATNRRLLRTIDFHLMPLLCLIYGLNYLDKTTLSYASIMGIKTDINLKGDDYQWLSSMFYFGYLGWEYPTNRLLQRLPLAKYSAFCVVAWGCVLALFATVSNFGGAVAIRCEFLCFYLAFLFQSRFIQSRKTPQIGNTGLNPGYLSLFRCFRKGRFSARMGILPCFEMLSLSPFYSFWPKRFLSSFRAGF